METEYWLQRWREGRTGWHHEAVMPLLKKHWPALGVSRNSRVVVPLCGKSVDMLWLADKGMRVLGVDVSPVAVESFLSTGRINALLDVEQRLIHGPKPRFAPRHQRESSGKPA